MKQYWLDLETFIEKSINDARNSPHVQGFIWTEFWGVKSEMERIKSEFYYQSLKEAGYF